jgi:hypothetical protein
MLGLSPAHVEMLGLSPARIEMLGLGGWWYV